MPGSHTDRGELHGITVVLDTIGDEVFIGRYFEERDAGVVLLDVDFHHDGAEGRSKADYVRSAAQYGQWKKLDSKTIPREQVRSIKPLADIGAV
jgi:hypothetical protein